MATQDISEIFEECIERLAAGQSIDDCIRLYPAYAAQLRPMLEMTEQLRLLRLPNIQLQADQALVWDAIQQQLPRRIVNVPRTTRRLPPLALVAVLIAMLALSAVAWVVLRRPNTVPETEPLPSATATQSVTPPPPSETPTITVTVTPTMTPTVTISVTPTLAVTTTSVGAGIPTTAATTIATGVGTISAPLVATIAPTFAPGCGAPISSADAAAIVLDVYPNTTVMTFEEITGPEGRPVWEVTTSHNLRLLIDIGCGYILTIEDTGPTSGPPVVPTNSSPPSVPGGGDSGNPENPGNPGGGDDDNDDDGGGDVDVDD